MEIEQISKSIRLDKDFDSSKQNSKESHTPPEIKTHVKYHYIRSQIQDANIRLNYASSSDNNANVFTKILEILQQSVIIIIKELPPIDYF